MKIKYLRNKKYLKSFLALGTTLSLLGFFCLISKIYFQGILICVLGIVFLLISNKCKGNLVKIENQMKTKCINCNENIIHETKFKYFVANALSNEEVFNNKINDKYKLEINYYKCLKCNICMTIIKKIMYDNNKEKILNDKISIDFNYNNEY